MGNYIEIATRDKKSYMIDYDLVSYIFENSMYMITLNGEDLVSKSMGRGRPSIRSVPEARYHLAHVEAQKARNNWVNTFQLPERRFDVLKGGYITDDIDYINERTIEVNSKDIESLREQLRWLEVEARRASVEYKKKWDVATKKTVEDMNNSIDNWGTAVSVAQFVRDLSTEFIIVGGVALTGPLAGMAVEAGGSLAKGVGKWVDTGSLQAGMMEATTSFVTVIIPGKNIALVLVKKASEVSGGTLVGLAEGKSLKESALSSALDVTTGMGIDKLGGKAVWASYSSLSLGAQGKIIRASLDKTSILVNITKATTNFSKGKLKGVINGKLKGVINGNPTETLFDLRKMDHNRSQDGTRILMSTLLVDYAIIAGQ